MCGKFVLDGKGERDEVSVANGKNIGYVVPQRLDRAVGGMVKLFFRVTNTFRDCVIRVKCGDKVLMERKKKIVVPGEMETVLLTERKLATVDGDLEVELTEN